MAEAGAEGEAQNRGKSSNCVTVKRTLNKVSAVETQPVTKIVMQWVTESGVGLLTDSAFPEVSGACAVPLSYSAAEGRWELWWCCCASLEESWYVSLGEGSEDQLLSFLCGSIPMLEFMLEQSFLAGACLVFLFIAEKDRIS